MSVLIPFILGFTLAYLLNPLVERFESVGLRRDRVVLVLSLILLVGGSFLLSWMIPRFFMDASNFISEIPAYTKSMNQLIDKLNAMIQAVLSQIVGSRTARSVVIPYKVDQLIMALVYKLPGNLMSMAHIGLWILIVPFVGFFALSEGRKWISLLFDHTPARWVEHLLGLFAELNARLGGYVRGVLLESMCVGLLSMVGLLFLGVQGAVVLGVLAGLVNVVPFMALIIGCSISILVAYFQGKAVVVLLGIFCLFILVRIIDDLVLIPFIVGGSVNLHPLFMLFAVLTGVEIAGFWGLIFAIPAAVVCKVVLGMFLPSHRESIDLKHHGVLS